VGTWNPASGQVYYAYSDWLGTKRYEADGGGNYVNSWASRGPRGQVFVRGVESLPFGDNQTALGAGVDATEHHFTGQERDAESGLDHFAARYYQSQTGRWLLPDWSATPVPVPYAAFTNPQSLNLYTYVGNNPVNAVDADGHEPPQSGNTGVGNNPSFIDGNPNCGAPGGVESNGLPSGSPCVLNDPGDGAVPTGTQAAQPLAWSSLSVAQQALVSGGEKGWNAMSPTSQDNFAAITHALENITMPNDQNGLPQNGLSQVKSASMRENGREMDVVWKPGAAAAFKSTGEFSGTHVLLTHLGANVLRKDVGKLGQGLELIFPTNFRHESQVHIDYNPLAGC
jgi:RHS repeat-associated protein